jgi:6-phosphogluconolactonase (cycloisomerase 2 family)
MAPINTIIVFGLSLVSQVLGHPGGRPKRPQTSKLIATHFSGQIYTLDLTVNDNNEGTLKTTSKTTGCGVTPTWLHLDEQTRTLYCFDESWMGSGVIQQYSVSPRDSSTTKLTLTGSAPTPGNSVHGSLYGGRDGKSFVITSE